MAIDPDRPPEPRGADKARAVRAGIEPPEPPPDAGEPMGADDDRPAMLGKRFRQTELMGMATGVVVALLGHWLLIQQFFSRDSNGWSWALAAVGGAAVGGALTLFLYGVSTDRTDTGPKQRGRADVSTEGEDRRSRRRRRRAASPPPR
jgi:uncharacterized membrane protein YeaQ/YmgE (transglycosylase-associated protein family)